MPGKETAKGKKEGPARAGPAEKKPAAKPQEKPAKPEAPRAEKPAARPYPHRPAHPPREEKPKEAKPGAEKPHEKPQEAPKEEKPGEAPKKQAQAIESPAGAEKPAWGVKTLLFNRWDTSDVKVEDPGIRGYVNLTPLVVPRTEGKYGPPQFQKNRMPIVERFMNKLMIPGHRGKKHKLTSGRNVGKTHKLYKSLKEAFTIIEKRTSKNPVQVLVKAVENSALLEEVASYRLGGIIARNSVITSPQRRVDLALRHLTQGIYKSSFRNRQRLANVIASELIAASENDPKSFAILERNRIEKEAEGAR
jgi:small subunit ribosomal protein S7